MPPPYEYSPLSANKISASFTLNTSNHVKKSSGKVPPIFSLNLAKICAISTGLICFAASNLKPSMPTSMHSFNKSKLRFPSK